MKRSEFLKPTPYALALGIAIFLPVSGFCQKQQIDRVISYLRGDWTNSDLSVVTPEIRDQVIQRIRKYAGGPFDEINGAGRIDYILLIRLGDMETTRQIVDSTRSSQLTGKGWAFYDALVAAAQPAVITLIAEDFFRDDGDKITPTLIGDEADYIRPLSIEMCRVAFGIVARSELFTPETKEWAKKNLEWADSSAPALFREIAQEWWASNKAQFLANDYRAVKPGRTLPAPSWAQPESDDQSTPPAAPGLPMSPHQPAAIVATSTPAVSSSGNIQTQGNSGNTYTWIAGLLLILCGGMAWLLKRKPN